MSSFHIEEQCLRGRRGRIETSHGTVETPALYPVLNFIGGTTTNSGGIWKYTRETLLRESEVSAVMMQAMGFLDYNITPDNLNEFWRQKPLHKHYEEYLDRPLFIDSGGFTLMNSETFGEAPEEGGSENPWEIYTSPESILNLQLDLGADIIATLDYPIPQNLREDEKVERMERSIESAVECLELLEDREEDPTVYIAIHGHDYETINWYVGQFLETAEDYRDQFEGFAVGSLVPIRSRRRIDMLVDIVQGAKDAIPEERTDEIALHVFGISGEMVPLLTALGVDSFDSRTYQQTAQYKDFIHPETWETVEASSLTEDWSCDCQACENLEVETMKNVLYSDKSYSKIDGYFKSEFYAKIAQHNFEIYQRQVKKLQQAIEEGKLLKHVAEFAQSHEAVAEGLRHAQLRDAELREALESIGDESLLAGPGTGTFQSRLTSYINGNELEDSGQRTISLKHGPSDFNINRRNYTPPSKENVLLVLPCSQKKPYRESRTQQAVLGELGVLQDEIHKVTISGLYGPVPETYEDERPVLEYEYVLTTEDREQVELVTSRLHEFLVNHGDEFEEVVGYTTSKAYRDVIETAFQRYGRGNIYPVEPNALQLTEHFRSDNIEELLSHLRSRI